jgi:hypothetical protein
MTLVLESSLSPPSVADMIELMRLNSNRVVGVTVLGSDGNPIDVLEEKDSAGNAKGELDLEITDLGGTSIYQENYYPPSIEDPTLRRILHTGTGKYSIKVTPDDIRTVGTYLFNWHARYDESSEDIYRTQVMQVISPRVLSLLPTFRLMLDKSVKKILAIEGCYLGYADSQLVMYLLQGLSYINAQPPYPVWNSLEAYPIEAYSDTLIRSSLYIGITSQSLFAIDTDIPSYSDQGHSFVLQHFQPLNTMANQLHAELDKVIPNLKKKFVRSGTAMIETRLGYLWYTMIASSPSGSLFRNYYFNT